MLKKKEPSYLSLLLWNSIDFCLWKLFYHCKCQKQFPLWEGSETDIFLALNQQMGFIVWVQMMPISPTRWVLKPKTLGKSLLIFIFTWCKMHFIWWHYQKVLKDFGGKWGRRHFYECYIMVIEVQTKFWVFDFYWHSKGETLCVYD